MCTGECGPHHKHAFKSYAYYRSGGWEILCWSPFHRHGGTQYTVLSNTRIDVLMPVGLYEDKTRLQALASGLYLPTIFDLAVAPLSPASPGILEH